MIIFPYSTALTLARPPIVTYGVTLLCCVIFYMQMTFPITESLMYYPESWNPVKMITSSVAHAGWLHLIGNMIFYLAFAPALEVLLGSKFRYTWIMIFISFAVGVSYSISTLIDASPALPSLGFSGVVMGMIGLSAFLMPRARIRVFWWYIIAGKTFFIRAWIVAVGFIGFDAWTMFTASDYGGINVVAHVAGGFAGYLYGYLWLKDRREEVPEELAHEIKALRIEQQHGKTRSEPFRYNKEMDQRLLQKQETQAHEKFMGKIYQMVNTHRDCEAINSLLEQYDLDSPTHDLEMLFNRIEEWGPSRTLLCIGRLIIHKLDIEKRDGKAIVYIEKCQKFSPQFLLSDLSRVLHYAEMALETGRRDVTKHLVSNALKRYGDLVNCDQCKHLLEKAGT